MLLFPRCLLEIPSTAPSSKLWSSQVNTKNYLKSKLRQMFRKGNFVKTNFLIVLLKKKLGWTEGYISTVYRWRSSVYNLSVQCLLKHSEFKDQLGHWRDSADNIYRETHKEWEFSVPCKRNWVFATNSNFFILISL